MEFEANGIVGGAIAKNTDFKPKGMIIRIFYLLWRWNENVL